MHMTKWAPVATAIAVLTIGGSAIAGLAYTVSTVPINICSDVDSMLIVLDQCGNAGNRQLKDSRLDPGGQGCGETGVEDTGRTVTVSGRGVDPNTLKGPKPVTIPHNADFVEIVVP
ncbi:hypothetical protein [Streptomyces sp. NPDC057623]|uniref:hypothetical protein n=1 Tax=Streptomyces sp. NPDC057623 TaxID=3346187 RepID=UPI0036C23A4F